VQVTKEPVARRASGSPPKSPSRGASSSTCPMRPKSGSAGRSRAANSAPDCGRW
jgi:hypothetical protein